VTETEIHDSVTEPRGRGSGRVFLAALAFLFPIAVAVGVVVMVAGDSSSSTVTTDGRLWSFVVPAGTKDLMDKGLLTEDILPEQLTVAVGDTVLIENQDSVVHSFGPFTVRPGESQKMTFSEPGYYFGVCTAGPHETITITVA
jgi:plastocyanin